MNLVTFWIALITMFLPGQIVDPVQGHLVASTQSECEALINLFEPPAGAQIVALGPCRPARVTLHVGE